MKKFISILSAAVMFAGILTGCNSSGSSQKNKDGKLSIVTTIFPQYDFVRQIAGDNVDITMLLSPGAESHSYEPTPQDIIKIQESDLFIYVGGEGDVWVDTIVDSMNKPLNTLTLMDCVDVVEEEHVEGMQEEEHEDGDKHDHDEEKEEAELDEHVWTSPKNAIKMVKCISDELCSIDAKNADEYKSNTEKYVSELEELDKKFEQIVSDGKRDTIIFADRFPLRYFADAYKLSYFAAFPGCSSDTEPSASTIAFLIDKIKEEKIPVVFNIEFSNKKVSDTISKSTGAKMLEFHSCHNVSSDDFKNGVTYLDLMNKNAAALNEALN